MLDIVKNQSAVDNGRSMLLKRGQSIIVCSMSERQTVLNNVTFLSAYILCVPDILLNMLSVNNKK